MKEDIKFTEAKMGEKKEDENYKTQNYTMV